jgi:hypothetical protein
LLRGKRANAERYCSIRIEDSPQLAAESFNIIQKDFPVVEEPFKTVAAKAGISGDEALLFASNRI